MSDDKSKAPELRRFKKAKEKRAQWDSMLQDAYRFALPNHDPIGNAQAGQRRDYEIYDNTAVTALQWKRARLHGQLFPPFREWMDYAPSIDEGQMSDADQKRWREYMADARAKYHQAFEASNFHIEVDPALGDCLISTGALLLHEGTPDDPLRFEAVPVAQIIPEESPDGIIRTMFRAFTLPGREILTRWDDARLPAEIAEQIERDGNAALDLVDCCIWQPDEGRFAYSVWLIKGEHRIAERTYKVSPWIVFRIDKAPGETMGRGPVLGVLGDIKTANKVVELVLKNASIAVTGIWQAEDDGVLNPANIKLVPGTIIPKAQGSSGLTPLQSPGRFDVSQLILSDLRDNIRRGIMGPALPPPEAAGRTAYEIGARQADHDAVELPMSLRLLTELDYPLAMRVLHILSSPKMAGSRFYIPEFKVGDQIVRPRPQSPLVRLQDIADAEQAHRAYLAGMTSDPQTVGGVVNRRKYWAWFFKQNGFPDALMNSETDQARFEAMVRQEEVKLQAQARAEAEAKAQQQQPQPEAALV